MNFRKNFSQFDPKYHDGIRNGLQDGFVRHNLRGDKSAQKSILHIRSAGIFDLFYLLFDLNQLAALFFQFEKGIGTGFKRTFVFRKLTNDRLEFFSLDFQRGKTIVSANFGNLRTDHRKISTHNLTDFFTAGTGKARIFPQKRFRSVFESNKKLFFCAVDIKPIRIY